MCTAGIDCQICPTIETCSKVRAAFPTDIEIEQSKRKQKNGRPKDTGKLLLKNKRGIEHKLTCGVHNCGELHLHGNSYCRLHRDEKNRAWRAKRKLEKLKRT